VDRATVIATTSAAAVAVAVVIETKVAEAEITAANRAVMATVRWAENPVQRVVPVAVVEDLSLAAPSGTVPHARLESAALTDRRQPPECKEPKARSRCHVHAPLKAPS
jgi:hypothetical protein